MAVVAAADGTALGDLAGIASLPGLPAALAGTLDKVWRAGIDLASEAARQPGPAASADTGRVGAGCGRAVAAWHAAAE